MPLSIPSTTATKANFADALKSFVDGLEVSVGTAQTTANAAQTLAGQKATKPAQGFGLTDLDIGALGLMLTRTYVNGAWQARGTTSTAVRVLWCKTSTAWPDPVAADGVIADHDIILRLA